MIKSVLAALLLIATGATGALADGSPGVVPSFPSGVTVYVTASVSTTDVNASFTASKSAKNAAQGATVLAAAKTAAGADTTVEDMGVASSLMGPSVETVRVTLAQPLTAAARTRLSAAGFNNDAIAVVARDPEGLRAQALAKATKSARVLAEAAAQGDGRHVGRLLNIAPSPLAMLGDLTQSFSNVPQVAALLNGGGTTTTATAAISGYYTFELAP